MGMEGLRKELIPHLSDSLYAKYKREQARAASTSPHVGFIEFTGAIFPRRRKHPQFYCPQRKTKVSIFLVLWEWG